MCGIVGCVDLKTRVETSTLIQMNNIASYRGPDDEGYVLVDENCNVGVFAGSDTSKTSMNLCDGFITDKKANSMKAVIAFGHRRLSVLDVTSAGHQPFTDAIDGCVVTYNGEIYNYLEIREYLEKVGYVFRTNTDTEVLLNAYREWGFHCVDQFNGMWAFAIWDPKKRIIFCSRDRFGAKPFHWWSDYSERFCFGSELKQVASSNYFERHINMEYLASNIVFNLSDYDDQTLIEGVHVLEPGHNLIVEIRENKINKIEVNKYWDLNVKEIRSCTEEETIRKIKSEIYRSCRLRLRSDVPLAILLSGGLDSSCLTAVIADLAKDNGNKPLITYSSSYRDDPNSDEAVYAELVNKTVDAKGHVLSLQPTKQNVDDLFSDLIWHTEGRCGITQLTSLMLARKISKDGFKVIVNGQCGDETMLGYERYYSYILKDIVKTSGIKEALKQFKLAKQNSRLSYGQLIATFFYFNFPVIRYKRQRIRAQKYCSQRLLSNLDKVKLLNLITCNDLNSLTYAELSKTQLPHIVRFDDRTYMAASVESRIPFMDYLYVEQSCKIPANLKVHNGWTKYLIRKAFEDKLPEEVIWRKNKMGFQGQPAKWLNLLSDSFINDLLQHPRSKNIFNIRKIKEISKKHRSSPEFEAFLWVEIFLRKFDVIA